MLVQQHHVRRLRLRGAGRLRRRVVRVRRRLPASVPGVDSSGRVIVQHWVSMQRGGRRSPVVQRRRGRLPSGPRQLHRPDRAGQWIIGRLPVGRDTAAREFVQPSVRHELYTAWPAQLFRWRRRVRSPWHPKSTHQPPKTALESTFSF